MLEEVIQLDWQAFHFVNGTLSNSFFDWLMPILRNKKTWIPLYLFFSFLLYKRYPKTQFLWALLSIGLCILLADKISSELVKKTVERLRPCNDPALQPMILRVHCGGGFSFTSSHACNHMAIASLIHQLIGKEWKKAYQVLLFSWAFSISIAQVYVGVHFPLDILAGMLLGFSIGYFCWFLFKKKLKNQKR